MGQRFWNIGEDGKLNEWFDPSDYWKVIFENFISKVIGFIVVVGVIYLYLCFR